MNIDIEFIEAFYNRLEKEKIDYCILRNVEEIINGDAHDIDMTVDARRLFDVEKELTAAASEHGWTIHIKIGTMKDSVNIKCYHLYKSVDGTIHIVHFDFFPTFSWNGYILIDNRKLLKNMNSSTLYHTAAPEVEAVTKLFIRLLHNGNIKSKYKKDIYSAFMNDPDEVKKLMKSFLDEDTVQFVYVSVLKERWEDIENNRDIIVNTLKKISGKAIFQQKLYLLKKAMSKAGIMVAFEGTDGSGKSTIINALPEVLENSFPDGMMDYFHWRPGFIKKEKKFSDGVPMVISKPHAQKPYGKLKSFAKFMFFNLDYILGYWCNVRWKISKGHLVVFDRYYYDYYLDKIRYRLNISDKILDIFKVLIPKPDVTFLLVGDPDALYERKREISVEEIQKQCNTLLNHQNKFNNSIVIDVNQPIETVVNKVAIAILENCAKKL